MPEWCQGHFKSIEAQAQKNTIEKGDKLKVVLGGMTFNPDVLENSEQEFRWRGSLWGLFNGDHYFRFEPSKTTPGSTTFTHGEEFSGPLAVLMKLPIKIGDFNEMAPKFEKFNEDLKHRVESMK